MAECVREGNKIVYYETIQNSYLGISKTIKANSEFELDQKIRDQKDRWKTQEDRQRTRDDIQAKKDYAEDANLKAIALIETYKSILKNVIQYKYSFDFEQLKRTDTYGFVFNISKPRDLDYYVAKHHVPNEKFWERFFKSIKETRLARYNDAVNEYNKDIEEYNKKYAAAYAEWQKKEKIFNLERDRYNQSIDQWHTNYNNKLPDAIEKYVSHILDNTTVFPMDIKKIIKDYAVEYDNKSDTLIIAMKLPLIENIPQAAGYKYVSTRKEISTIPVKQKKLEALYDDVISQLTLSIIYMIFSSDTVNACKAITYNGYVDYIDTATGNDTNACIISVHCTKSDFKNLNLKRVEAKECLKGLKAIRAAALSTLTPVKPIMQLNKNDSRFIAARSVLDDIEVDYNLSEMPWEDFEHLVRELFAMLFSQEGAEVKVTKASKDGGVDAIAFDPDPIRGGKFVIQAKRYTKVVPVSAVRDLYGTMINEGAVKGILVTTSHYGHDTYTFAKDKPISLIDGNNLVYLLQKVGYIVKVNK